MSDELERRVRVFTGSVSIEGLLRLGPRIRTLDDLNIVSRRFVVLDRPSSADRGWTPYHSPLAINKDGILFVEELTEFRSTAGAAARSHTRAPLALRVGDYAVSGLVHVPPGGDALARLNQDRPRFIALTSCSVFGNDVQLAVPFLAVNRSHVLAAQVMVPDDPAAAESPEARTERV